MGAHEVLLFLILGLAAGVLSGLIGIGGGILIVPALIFIFGMDQHQAQGTTLAMMVPPIGILAAWTYYKNGHADIKVAGVLCIGFFFGGLFGARAANLISSPVIEKIFGVALLLISLKMILSK
ncbi:MAG: sulfite exporter TauE/SafE family protein [Deltaproteobacteria bacterium]|nr:sulfite exporter TauE/SafE family protein [Deltaproteobacteria bacterium]